MANDEVSQQVKTEI